MKRFLNFFYYYLYFKWARILFSYTTSNYEFEKYHYKSRKELHLVANDPNWENRLFDYDEIFISPCTLNEINCGGVSSGKYLLKIRFLGFECGE